MTNFPKNTELVISRYNEDLHWLDESLLDPIAKITIYNKGQNNTFKMTDKVHNVLRLENMGRESHTYLYHVIRNYDNLADMTIFLPGSMENKFKWGKLCSVFDMLNLGCNDAFPAAYEQNIYDCYRDFYLNDWSSANEQNNELNGKPQLRLSEYRPYGEWYKHHFGNECPHHKTGYCGIFAVDRRYILRRPRSFYEGLIKELETSSNPEVGHYYERAWSAIFSVPGKYPMYI